MKNIIRLKYFYNIKKDKAFINYNKFSYCYTQNTSNIKNSNHLFNFNDNDNNKITFEDTIEINDFNLSSTNALSMENIINASKDLKNNYEINNKSTQDIINNTNSNHLYNINTTSKYKTREEIINNYILKTSSNVNNETNKDKININLCLYSSFKKELYRDKNYYFNNVEKVQLYNFIKNCLTYNLDHYLESISYFKNKEIRNYVLNTQLLEKNYHDKNPYSRKAELISDLSIKTRYEQLLKFYKSKEEVPPTVNEEYYKNKSELDNLEKNKYVGYNTIDNINKSNNNDSNSFEKVLDQLTKNHVPLEPNVSYTNNGGFISKSSNSDKKLNADAEIEEDNKRLINFIKNGGLLTNESEDNLRLNTYEENVLLLDRLLLKSIEKDSKESNNISSLGDHMILANKNQEKKDYILLGISKIRKYPGSDSGPNPADDMDHFRTWFKANHPEEINEALIRIIDRLEKSNEKFIIASLEKRAEEYKFLNKLNSLSSKKTNLNLDTDIDGDPQFNEDTRGFAPHIQQYLNLNAELLPFLAELEENEEYKEAIYEKRSRLPQRENIYTQYHLHNVVEDEQFYQVPDEDYLEIYDSDNDDDVSQIFHKDIRLKYFDINQSSLSPIPPKLNYKPAELNFSILNWGLMMQEPDMLKFKKSLNYLKYYNNYMIPDILRSAREGYNYERILRENIYSRSLYTLLDLYPKVIRKNKVIKDIIQVASKNYYYNDKFDHVHNLIDILAISEFDIVEKNKKETLNMIEGCHPYPKCNHNLYKLGLIQYIEDQVVPGPDYFDIYAEEYFEEILEDMNYEVYIDTEEEDKKEAKRIEDQNKRELEAAKAAGKEALDAYKKKKEEEEKLKLEEEEKKEQEEYEKFLAEEARKEEEMLKEIEAENKRISNMKSNDRSAETGISKEVPEEELVQNKIKDPFDFLGTDNKKKHLVEGGLPKLNMNFHSKELNENKLVKNDIDEDEDEDKEDTENSIDKELSSSKLINYAMYRDRYIELHNKMTKLLINKEEEQELIKLLETKSTDPVFYSKITGIPLSDVIREKESKRSFVETYFKKGADIKLTSLELQIAENEVNNIEKRNTNEANKDDENENSNIFTNLDYSDVYTKPIPDYSQSKSPFLEDIPIDFYDNDDGFWDDYINMKKNSFDVKNLQRRPFGENMEILKKRSNNLI